MSKLELPALSGGLSASSVVAWLAKCEDAFEAWHGCHTDNVLKPSLQILSAGLRMESFDAAQWWGENRETLKELSSWSEFTTKVKERFVPSGWNMDALLAFYSIRHQARPFDAFVSDLQSARSALDAAGEGWPITEAVYKNHLLLFAHPMLSLRVRAVQGLDLPNIKVTTLIDLMSSIWNSMIAEGVVCLPLYIVNGGIANYSSKARSSNPPFPGWTPHFAL